MSTTAQIIPFDIKNQNHEAEFWKSFEHITWQGNQPCTIADYPSDRKEFWGKYAIQHIQTTNPHLLDWLTQHIHEGIGKVAIELGCGFGPAIPYLLEKGWTVIAIDYAPKAIDSLAEKYRAAIESRQLTCIVADISSNPLDLPPADLVIATDVFPYTDPKQFPTTWKKVHQLIKPEGRFIGSFLTDFKLPSSKPVKKTLSTMGAWFLKNDRIVPTLLRQAGYTIERCEHLPPPGLQFEPITVQFLAKKPLEIAQ